MEQVIFENQSEIFEKIVRDRSGRVFRVRFVVVERGGILRGRVVSCEQISTLSPFSKGECRVREVRGWSAARKTQLYFPLVKKLACPASFRPRARSTASPYFNKFAFFTATKIRAPAYAADGRGLDMRMLRSNL